MKISKQDRDAFMESFTKAIASISKTTTVETRKSNGDNTVNVTDEYVSITKYIKGITGLGWAGASNELELYKALGQDNEASGGVFVPTALSGEIIELLKEKAVVRSMPGVQTIDLAGDKLKFNRVTDPPVISWGEEAGSISEDTGIQFGSEELELKKAVCLYKLSRELMENANTSVDALVRNELADALALEEDKVFLNGTGGTQPLGLYWNPRVVSTTISTTPTYDTFKDAAYQVRLNQAEVNGWIAHPRTAQTLAELKDGAGRYAKNLGGTPDGNYSNVSTIDGAVFKQTTQIPIVLKPAANDSFAVGGDWSNFLIGQKPNIRIETSMEKYFDTDQIGLRLVSFVGSLVKQTGSFVVIKGIQ